MAGSDGSLKIHIWDILDVFPKRRKTDHLFSCFHCGGEITIDDPYMDHLS